MISISTKKSYLIILALGIICLITARLSISMDNMLINYARTISGIFFVLFFGLPLVSVLKNKDEKIGGQDILLSIWGSLLLLYPIGVLNVFIEGKEDIYREHLSGVMIIAITFFFLMTALDWYRNKWAHEININISKIEMAGLTAIITVGSIIRLYALGEANINGDEMNLAPQSYDLVDGMMAGRSAYFISETGHSPLGFFISHFIYNILEPRGFYEMGLWMLRAPQVIMGILVIFGTYVLAKRLFKGRHTNLVLIPPLLIAIDSYSNFASRLAIFQDMSVFTFFVIILLILFTNFIEERTWKNAVFLGVGLGGLFLVKASGLLFVPLLVLLAIIYFKDWKKIILAGLTSILVFSPVIFYNIAAYIKTGFMDVPFTKIANMFGIPAESLMTIGKEGALYEGFRNPILTFMEMPFALIDQWGIGLFIVFLWSAITGLFFIKKNKSAYVLLYATLLISIIFFSLNGFRTYYMAYFSVIMSCLVSLNISNFKQQKALTTMLLLIAIPFSLIFNINTNILLKEPSEITEYGRSGDSNNLIITYYNQLKEPYSLGAISFLSDGGWDELQAFIEEKSGENTVLILDENLNELSLEWYLHINDIIREFYADSNYKERYKYVSESDWDGETESRILISRTEKGYDFAGEEIIRDEAGNEEFYIYY